VSFAEPDGRFFQKAFTRAAETVDGPRGAG